MWVPQFGCCLLTNETNPNTFGYKHRPSLSQYSHYTKKYLSIRPKMLPFSSKISILPLCFLLFCIAPFTTQASVPSSAQFTYTNQGDFGDYIVEYDANYRVLDPFNSPFQLCFYNTTPNAFTLALRMGTVRSESLMRWVWEANRGSPVRQNATLTFRADGNLVLADADGRVAWQTNTANKGVVGFNLLATGNMVLYDSKGKFIWQSFDSPTDTLLVGQSLRVGAATQLVSRASEKVNANGAYSLVMESKTLSMYYKSPNTKNPILYYSFSDLFSVNQGDLAQITFGPNLSLTFQGKSSSSGGTLTLRRARYNATLSYLRLGIDGNLKFYTFDPVADYSAWEVTYALFDRDSTETECQLPEKCGNLGICSKDQCVACPSPNGLQGWSEACQPTIVASCAAKDITYYELVGVDHFSCKYTSGEGPMKQDSCRDKCTKDCKCLGYFYRTDSLRCWTVNELKTLTQVSNAIHVAYIKAPVK